VFIVNLFIEFNNVPSPQAFPSAKLLPTNRRPNLMHAVSIYNSDWSLYTEVFILLKQDSDFPACDFTRL